MKIPIALQLYSVRHDAAQDLLGVIGKVAKMGYDGVEFAGFHGHAPADIRRALDDAGIRAEGTHTPLSGLEDATFGPTVEAHQTLGCEYVILPWIPEEMRNTPEACRATGARLTEICDRLRPHGLRLGFHAHHQDMTVLEGGRSAYHLLGESTPSDFIMQYDTANGMQGGADAAQPIRDFPGRNASLHLKEWAGSHGAALLGEGHVPLAEVFDAAENGGGVRWYVVEHEDESLMPPIEAVERCLQNLRKLGK